ncbi:hypothetical protein [Bradyrhizobium sp. STM 3557]|uniref:hypothetical protein n=1 Tax=Bradyrhizobium sp. STM 3557 TaxID=578920 RepID=UPI00388E70A6
MAFDAHAMPRLAPVARRHAPLFCFALLSAASTLASLVFACATPFAAFAVIAAAQLPLRQALPVVVAAWLVNQGIGFGVLHYPTDATTMLWGLVIGVAAASATLAASAVLRVSSRRSAPPALTLAMVCAYASYELVLLAATPVLGGAASFTVAVVARIGLTSTAWMIGLVATCEIVRLLNSARLRRTV